MSVAHPQAEVAAPHDASDGLVPRIGRVASLLAVLVLVAWIAWSLGWPASADGQVFLWLADLAAGRGVPYADAFETKGPASWAPLVPLVRAFGRADPMVLRIADAVFCVVGALACRAIAARWARPALAGVAALLHVAWWAALDYDVSAQPDAWVGALLAAAVALALRGGVAATCTAGLLVGASAMVKPFYAAFLLVPAILVAARPGRWARLAALVAGGAAGAGAFVLLLVSLGAWTPWLACLRWTATVYTDAGAGLLTRIAPTLAGVVAMPHGVLVLPAVGALALLWLAGQRAWALAAATWLAGTLAVVFVQGRNFPYYWLPMKAPLAILGVVALDRLVRRDLAREVRAIGATGLVLTVLLALLGPAQQGWRWARSRGSDAARLAYEAREFGSFGRQPGAVLPLADSLLRTGGPRDRILVWGAYAGVGPLLDRPAATRYAIIRPLFEGEGTAARDSLRRAFLAEISAAPPTWWLAPTPALPDRRVEQAGWPMDSIPGVTALLDARYDVVARRREWTVHRLREAVR